jgi:hypothetical protein
MLCITVQAVKGHVAFLAACLNLTGDDPQFTREGLSLSNSFPLDVAASILDCVPAWILYGYVTSVTVSEGYRKDTL